jgi:hypothetical protein
MDNLAKHFNPLNRILIHFQIFYVDPRGIDWHHYNDTFCFGTKKFILNEDENEIPAARANLRR